MSRVADDFAARFDAALLINKNDKSADAAYNRLNEFVRKLAALEDVSACLDKYLAIYARYPCDDPRSEMIFAMLVERRIALTPPDDDFVDTLYEESFHNRRPLSKVGARVDELDPKSNRRNGILQELKKARDKFQRSGSIIDPLKQMYRNAHGGEAAKTVAELYGFDPWPDAALEVEYRKHVAAVGAAWVQAERMFVGRNYGYDDATRESEAERLKNTGYNGFALRFEKFTEWLAKVRFDTRAVFQLLKWARDPLWKAKEVRGRDTRVQGGNAVHREYEIYAHIVLAVYINAVGHRHLLRIPEGFTSMERSFFLDPMHTARYYSNFLNRFRMVFHNPDRTQGPQPADLRATRLANVDTFTSLATLTSQLILFARSQKLELASDSEVLTLQQKITSTPWDDLVTRRFSTMGISNWAYANDTFGIGAEIGTNVRIAYFEGDKPTSIYLELSDAPGFLFAATVSSLVKKVETGLFQLLWLYLKGLIGLIQKFFEFIGYLPVFVEYGFVGMVREIIQDQVIGAGLEDASKAFGKNLSSLQLFLGPLTPGHSPHGTKVDNMASFAAGSVRIENATTKATRALTGEEAKLANRLTPTEPGGTTVAGSRLASQENRMANVPDTALLKQDQRAAKALENRPLTPEEQRALEAAIDGPLSHDELQMQKAIRKWVDKHDHRMAQAQAQIAESKTEMLQRANVASDIQGRQAVGQTGALDTRASGGKPGGGPSGTGRVESTGTPDAPPPKKDRQIITVEPKPKPPAPPPPPKPEIPFHKRTGKQIEDEELRKLVLDQHGERIRGIGTDPTTFLGVHEPVTIDGRRYGGRNKVRNVLERLAELSPLRVERGRTPLPQANFNPNELEYAFIKRHPELDAHYQNLEDLVKGVRVPEFERLDISPGRIAQIRRETWGIEKRLIGDLRFDVFEAWFGRGKRVQVADLTLMAGDPYHKFKTLVYVRVAEEMLPGFPVKGFDIKPLANGTYILVPIE